MRNYFAHEYENVKVAVPLLFVFSSEMYFGKYMVQYFNSVLTEHNIHLNQR